MKEVEGVASSFNELMYNVSIYKSIIQIYSTEEADKLLHALAKYDISATVGLPNLITDESNFNARVYLDTAENTASYLHRMGHDTCVSLVYVRDMDAFELLFDIVKDLVLHCKLV